MSRNRSTTTCTCGLVDLATFFDTMPVDDVALLSQAAYWGPAYAAHTMGYSFRADLVGNVYHWVRRNAAGEVTAACTSPVPDVGYVRELAWTYAVPNPADRYRWKHLTCPVCRRTYAGWYVQQPASLDPPCYELYDTSFFHARNDEPGEADEAEALPWTPTHLVRACQEYVTRGGLRR